MNHHPRAGVTPSLVAVDAVIPTIPDARGVGGDVISSAPHGIHAEAGLRISPPCQSEKG